MSVVPPHKVKLLPVESTPKTEWAVTFRRIKARGIVLFENPAEAVVS